MLYTMLNAEWESKLEVQLKYNYSQSQRSGPHRRTLRLPCMRPSSSTEMDSATLHVLAHWKHMTSRG